MRFIMKQGADSAWHFAFVPIRADQLDPRLAEHCSRRGAIDLGLEIATGYVWDLRKDIALGRNRDTVKLAAAIRDMGQLEEWESWCQAAAEWMEDVRQRGAN